MFSRPFLILLILPLPSAIAEIPVCSFRLKGPNQQDEVRKCYKLSENCTNDSHTLHPNVNWTKIKESETDGVVYKYFNLSFSNLNHWESTHTVQVKINDGNYEQCWELVLTQKTNVDWTKVDMDFLRITGDDNPQIQVQKLVTDDSTPKTCDTSEEECDYLHNNLSLTIIPFPVKKTVQLKIQKNSTGYDRELDLELHGAACPIECNRSSNCSHNETWNATWNGVTFSYDFQLFADNR